MPECYAQIIKMLQERGVHPVHLTVRTVEGPGNQMVGAANSGYASLPRDGRTSTRSGHGDLDEASGPSDLDLLAAHRRALATAFPDRAPPDSIRDRMPAPHGPAVRGGRGSAAADQQLMTLLRRLTAVPTSGELGPVGLLGRRAGGNFPVGGGGYPGGGGGRAAIQAAAGGYPGGGGGYPGGSAGGGFPGGSGGYGGDDGGYPGTAGYGGPPPGYAGTGYGGGLPPGFDPGAAAAAGSRSAPKRRATQ